MPFDRTGHWWLTLLCLVCVCSSAAAASSGLGTGHPSGTSGCFPRIESVDRGEAVGDVVDVETLLCFEGTVTVSGPDYEGTATLGDGTGSGVVTLHLNTHRDGAAVFGVTSDRLDSVPLTASGGGSFQPGTYTVTVRDRSGDVAETATVELGAPRARNLTLWRAPRGSAPGLERVADARASRDAVDRVDSRRRTVDPVSGNSLAVATNETVVVRVRADGLAGAMAEAEGSPLARFRTALRETGAGFELEQTAETVTPERRPLAPDVLNSTGARVVPDPENDTYYLVVDTRRLWGSWGGTHGGRVNVGSRPGMGYAFRFSMREPLTGDGTPPDLVSADFFVVEPAVEFPRVEGDRVVVAPGSDARLAAETTLAPGSVVSLQVSGAVNRTVERLVRARGASRNPGFVVPLNLSSVPSGATATVGYAQGDAAGEENAVTAVVRMPNATLDVPRELPVGDSLSVRLVTVTHPSVVAVYSENRTLVGTAAVGPGTTENVSVAVNSTLSDGTRYRVVVYRDADRSGSVTEPDEVYRRRGTAVSASVSVTPPTATTSRGTTAVQPTSHRSTETGATTPGFGILVGVFGVFVAFARFRRTAT